MGRTLFAHTLLVSLVIFFASSASINAQYPDPTWPWPTTKEVPLVPTPSNNIFLTQSSTSVGRTNTLDLLRGTGPYSPGKVPLASITYNFGTPILLTRMSLKCSMPSAGIIVFKIEGGITTNVIDGVTYPVINRLFFSL